jgi:membrane protease YdiL (CAAX protease family)
VYDLEELGGPEVFSPPGPTIRQALVVFVAWAAVTIGLQLLQMPRSASDIASVVRGQIVWGVVAGATFVSWVVISRGWSQAAGLRLPTRLDPARPAMVVLALFLALGVAAGGYPAPMTIVITLTNTLFVGISEELMFRGVIQGAAMRRMSPRAAVLFSAAIFGPIHVANGFITQQPLLAVGQAGFAFVFGIWAGAIRLRTDSVLPTIGIHWLWDGLLVLGGPPAALVALPAEIGLGIYGLMLMRGYGRQR